MAALLARLDHARHERLNPVRDTVHVHAVDPLEVRRLGLPEVEVRSGDARVVAEDVTGAVGVEHLVGQGLDGLGLGDVGHDRKHVAAQLRERDEFGRQGRRVVEALGTLPGEPSGDRLAYVTGAEGGKPQLYVRWMDTGQTALLTNLTEAPQSIAWSPDGKQIAINDIAAKTTRLEQDFRELSKNSVRVRSVIAVPGWHAESQSSDGHLVVNERTLPMLRGWRDEADYLMDEDVQALQQHLTKSGKRSPLARRKRK